MDYWTISVILYLFVALGSFVPVAIAIAKRVKLNPGGVSFEDSPHFTPEAKALLSQHYSRMNGTLVFWKNKAEWHKRFHYYTMIWTIPVSVVIPIVSQSGGSNIEAHLFLTVIATHSALLMAFHRALKIENNFKSFRHGESEFYDLYRRMLDRPLSFGSDEKTQIDTYFREVEKIRRIVRTAETDNLPILEQQERRE